MGWVAIDSNFYKELMRTKRSFTRMEAAFCLTFDLNVNRPWTIQGYSKIWGWSRNKVRKFVSEVLSQTGSLSNGSKNTKGHPIRLIGNGSRSHKDTPLNIRKNTKGHQKCTPINGFGTHKDTHDDKKTPNLLDRRAFQVR